MNALKLAVIVAAITFAIAACGQTATKPNVAENVNKAAVIASPDTGTKPVDELASGNELYVTNCQICHRDTGKGGKITVEGKHLDPIDLTSDKVKKRDDAKLLKQIGEGAPDDGMPAFKDKLSPDQIKQIVQYVRKLQAGPVAPVSS
jgi:mono/diheme cytochrome c family protein